MNGTRRTALVVALCACGTGSDGPHTLSVTPLVFHVVQGGAPIAVTAHVATAFAVDVVVSIPTLPAGLSATSAVLAAGEIDATLFVSASLEAVQGPTTLDVRAGANAVAVGAFVRGCPGCVDTTFNSDSLPTQTDARFLAVDAIDRIVLGGLDASGVTRIGRFDGAGFIDASFGAGGEAMVSVPGATWSAITVDTTGRVIVVGATGTRWSFDASTHAIATRLTSNGEVDASFGESGVVVLPLLGAGISSATVLADGSLVAAGWRSSDLANIDRFWLAKLTPAGALDPTFGTSGIRELAWSYGTGNVVSVARAVNDDLLVGGTTLDSQQGIFVERFKPDGSVVTSFGSGGQSTYVLGDASQMTALPDGRTIVSMSPTSQFVMFRADGWLDDSFGAGGVVELPPSPYYSPFPLGAAPDGEGTIVVTGVAWWSEASEGGFLARLNADGSMDDGFGKHGFVIPIASQDFAISIPVVQTDGRIVLSVTDHIYSTPTSPPFLRRYWN